MQCLNCKLGFIITQVINLNIIPTFFRGGCKNILKKTLFYEKRADLWAIGVTSFFSQKIAET
jgi:hypothetical protein